MKHKKLFKWLQLIFVLSSINISQAQNYSEYNLHNETLCDTTQCILQTNGLTNRIHMSDPSLISSSIIYGLLSISSENQLSEKCYKHMHEMYDAIHRKEIWAMKALDSSARSQPGFVMGNNYWLGSIKGCSAVKEPYRLTLSNRFPRDMKTNLLHARAPFDIEYRMIYARHKSPWQIQVEFLLTEKMLHIGLCLPTSCSHMEISNLTQLYLDSNLLSAQNVFEHHPEVILVKDLHLNPSFYEKTSVKIVGSFIALTMIVIILSALYEPKTLNESKNIHQNETNNNNNETENNCDNAKKCDRYTNVRSTATINDDKNECVNNLKNKIDDLQMERRSNIEKVFDCFSVTENFKTVSKTTIAPNSIPVINGFKSVGCFLILIFHMNWFAHFSVHNPAMMFAYGEQALWQWVSATPIIVDVFFTISGLLLSYNFFRNKNQCQVIQENSFIQNCKLFGRQLLHRYLRLTPLYLVVMGMTEISTSYLVETSAFWVNERYDQICQKYWWRNLFYIQNLFDVKDLCLNWTWSMACEMQFFILFTALLFLHVKKPAFTKKLYIGMFFGFFAIIFAIAIKSKFTPAYDVMHDLGGDLYIAPWTRILPYLIGVGAGWAYYNMKNGLPLSSKSIGLCWTLATTTAIMSHLSTINRDISYIWAAPIITAIRILYSSAVSWMIVASALGHGGWFARLMSFKWFVHINKLSYGIYLLNPFVISVIYGSKDHSTHIDPITSTIMSIGVMVVVYLLSFVFSLLFEMPYTNLAAILLRKPKVKVQ